MEKKDKKKKERKEGRKERRKGKKRKERGWPAMNWPTGGGAGAAGGRQPKPK